MPEDSAVLRSEIQHLRDVIKELKDTVHTLTEKLEHMDRRHNDTCRSCTAWTRISTLEISVAEAKGIARGWALGAAGVAGAASFLAGLLFRG